MLLVLTLAALAAGASACSNAERPARSDTAAPAGRAGEAGAAARFRILVFSKTTGYRHRSIGDGVAAIRRLGARHGFAVDHTEDAGRFARRDLGRYAAVVFLSTTGTPLAPGAQRRGLQRYIRGGGGFLGIHAASDSLYDWPWYVGLVGASFRSHAAGAPPAVVRVSDTGTAMTRRLPRAWRRSDEWYAFRSNPRGRVRVLATLDESTYDPGDSAMGADHPIIWCHRYDGGRSVYTALGHTRASYTEPRFVGHLLGGIRMAAGRAAFSCGA